jgi:hypothetical protein
VRSELRLVRVELRGLELAELFDLLRRGSVRFHPPLDCIGHGALLGAPTIELISTYVWPSRRRATIFSSRITRIRSSGPVVDLLGPDPLARDGSPFGVVAMRAGYSGTLQQP